jgi:signal transduction histidine kinase
LNNNSDMTESLMLSRDDIISKMIHQIRNPLATIIISASQISLKSDDVYDSDDRMLLGFINSEADRIERLLSNYSKLISASHLIKKDSSLGSLMENLRESSNGYCESGIAIEFENVENTPGLQLHVDECKITEALTQILENGIENLKNNKGSIKITGRHENGHASISIKDNGPGIRPERLRKVKEPFYSTKEGGSGLGLTIASRIAAAHGGELCINSVEGCETEVSLLLPCK